MMESVDSHIVSSGMDPGPVPNATLNFGLGTAALYGGQLSGLSTMHRDGLATIDKVADWVFLYANVAVENLQMEYDAVVKATSEVSGVQISANVERVALYLVARYDLYTNTADIDQFIITEFGKIDVNIEGLGVLGYVLEPLADVVTNLIHEDVANILETTGKEYLQEALNETPWP
ncbi:hypothetical protein CGJ15_25345 [Vibrio parahaemolyticus]|nr:hypothetical protein CGJ15_25345 [Vibrio parahaemolyticus]